MRDFDYIGTETTDDDKRSLIALRELVAAEGPFSYLEIGSHLGGSIQPYIADTRCTAIVSIDPRPLQQPDDGVGEHGFPGNSTDRMLSNLAQVPGADMGKITTIEAGTDTIDPTSVTIQPALCFVDGEHTATAALRDGLFCAAVAPRSIVAFHDENRIAPAISTFMRRTGGYGCRLPSSIFVVDLSGSRRLAEIHHQFDWLWRAANRVGMAGEIPRLFALVRRLRVTA